MRYLWGRLTGIAHRPSCLLIPNPPMKNYYLQDYIFILAQRVHFFLISMDILPEIHWGQPRNLIKTFLIYLHCLPALDNELSLSRDRSVFPLKRDSSQCRVIYCVSLRSSLLLQKSFF